MYTPRVSTTTKRVLSLVAASALAVTGIVSVAASSQAAGVPSVKLLPTTGSSAGGTVVTVTGKGFQNAGGTSQVEIVANHGVWFETATCDINHAGTAPSVDATAIAVQSATKLTVTTGVLALVAGKPTVYNLCIQSTATVATVLGTAKFTAYDSPFINDQVTPATAGLSTKTGSAILGDNFTTKTTATIDGKPLTKVKVVIGSGVHDAITPSTTDGDDTLTGIIPAGTGANKTVTVTSEGGATDAIVAANAQTFSWLSSLNVIAPAYGNGSVNDVITVTGSGFKTQVFAAAAATKSQIYLVKGGSALAAGGTVPLPANSTLCDRVQVETDTTLTCQLNVAATDGAYTVVDVTDGASAVLIGAISSYSRGATYTVSDF
jgi:hypothetical protein